VTRALTDDFSATSQYCFSCVSIHFSLPSQTHPQDPSHYLQVRDSSDTEGTGDRYAFYASAVLAVAYLCYMLQTLAEKEKQRYNKKSYGSSLCRMFVSELDFSS